MPIHDLARSTVLTALAELYWPLIARTLVTLAVDDENAAEGQGEAL